MIGYVALIEDAMQTLNTYRGMRDWGQLTDKDVDDAYRHFIGKLKLLPVHFATKTEYGMFVREGNIVYQLIFMGDDYLQNEINLGDES